MRRASPQCQENDLRPRTINLNDVVRTDSVHQSSISRNLMGKMMDQNIGKRRIILIPLTLPVGG